MIADLGSYFLRAVSPRHMTVRTLVPLVIVTGVAGWSTAQGPAAHAPDAIKADSDGNAAESLHRHHVMILLGLPGDAEHETHFRKIAAAWRDWLIQLGIHQENIVVLSPPDSQDAPQQRAATKESITQTLTELSQRLHEEDAFWLCFLGHADHDGQHARFHIPGPDLRAIDFADLLQDLRCQQQVLWLTMGSSGWFLEPLSHPNRVVITATQADAEPNETEFPAALVEATRDPVELDLDKDQQISLLELFARTVEIVNERYGADERAATEHAMLDDNGDGRGSPWEEIKALRDRTPEDGNLEFATAARRIDGRVAARIVLPIPLPTSAEQNEDVAAEIELDEDF